MGPWEGIDEFVAVAETGSFTRAAARLRVSSSHVSRQLARLEDRLGARLFFRTTRRVAPTEAGQLFYGRCRRLLAERDLAFEAVGDLQEQPRGLLRLTSAVTYGERFVVPLVNDFLALHPQLSVEIHLTNEPVDLVEQRFDLAVRLGRLPESSLVATRLAPRAMYLCAAPAYLDRRGTPERIDDLAHHDCLVGTSDSWSFHEEGGERLLRPQGRWRCNSGLAVLDAALRGAGICQLPDYYVSEHVRAGRLVALLPHNMPPNAAVWAVYPQKRHLAARVRLLIEHLRAGLAERPEYR